MDAPAADDAVVDHDAALGDGPAGKSVMTFFVTSTGSGPAGGNLGGIAGADAKCQQLATAVGGGDHTWRAYLGTQGTGGEAPTKRIGPGPWKNQKGKIVETNVVAIYTVNIDAADILDEKGDPIPVNERVLLTGSAASGQGRQTYGNGTCTNWTSTAGVVAVGHTDSSAGVTLGPNEVMTRPEYYWDSGSIVFNGCTAAGMTANKSSGRFACFAKD